MGRPLFSQTYHSKPVVRTEPEPGILSYERWTHWNAFDPDSEEFFENDPVFEAFIDPSIINPTSTDDGEQTLVVEEGISSGSSEGSASDRGSPMAVGSDDPVRMLAEAYPYVDWEVLTGQLPALNPETRPLDVSAQYAPRFNPNTTAPRQDAQGFMRNRQRSATLTVIPQRLPPAPLRSFISTSPTDNLPRTSNITPISIPSRTTPANHPSSPATPQSPFIPSTPPSQVVPLNQMTPSPVSTVTPRILTWSSRPPMTPGSPTQINGPLTNPSARMSLAHIVPTFIRVRDVVI